jgi:hypothetical protein
MVYPLLNTLRCKRCKNIWKEDDPDGSAACGTPGTPLRIRKRTDPLETRLEKKLDEYLTRHRGKFCIGTMTWQAGDISQALFRSYLLRCVKNRTLAEMKDRYGRTWYERPG